MSSLTDEIERLVPKHVNAEALNPSESCFYLLKCTLVVLRFTALCLQSAGFASEVDFISLRSNAELGTEAHA